MCHSTRRAVASLLFKRVSAHSILEKECTIVYCPIDALVGAMGKCPLDGKHLNAEAICSRALRFLRMSETET